MEDFFVDLTNGNVAEVKILLASVILALAIYQLPLIAVNYRKLRPSFLSGPTAGRSHRAIGDVILLLTVLVAVMCLSVYGFDEGGVHAVAGIAILAIFAVKTAIIRSGNFSIGRFLPVLGISLFALFVVAWATTASEYVF